MNLEIVCSHRRGDEHITLCCVSELDDGKAIAFQLTGTVIEISNDPSDREHLFPSIDLARHTLRLDSFPHA
jgi:hypothetical protein